MADPTERARDEFLSEAQEIVETLSRNLLDLDASVRSGSMLTPRRSASAR